MAQHSVVRGQFLTPFRIFTVVALAVAGVVWVAVGDASAQSTAAPGVAAAASATSDQRAQTQLLDKQLRTVRIQELLIESGNLDKETGHVSQPVLHSAVRDFRAAIGSNETGPMTDAELKVLDTAAEAFLTFADYQRVTDQDTRITVTLPRNLFGVAPKPKTEPDTVWSTYVSSYGGLQLHVFRYRALAETPVSLVTRLLDRRQQLTFERLEITGGEFAVDATGNYSSGRSYFYAIRGWETAGDTIGFIAEIDLEYSQALQVPSLVIPQAAKTTVHPNGRNSDRTIQVSEREGNWRRVIRALVNRIGSDFETSNGWKVLSSAECKKRQVTSGRRAGPKVVRVVFATDRKKGAWTPSPGGSGRLDVDRLYGAEPGDELSIGCAIVSVPPEQLVAARIGRPRANARGEAQAFDVNQHFGLDSVVEFGSAASLGRGEELLLVDEGKEGVYERALLYIHGYNTQFADALLRIAQIGAAVDQDLRVYLFSWPSRAKYSSYFEDMDNAERAEQSLKYFMKLILRDANVRQLDVIAHSMGSQSLLRSIDGLRQVFDQRVSSGSADGKKGAAQVRLRLGQVIFAAPDVSRSIFERQLAVLAPYARRVTVYTSAVDRALWISEIVRWKTPRAGYLGTATEPFRLAASNVHVIDVTGKPLPKLSPKLLSEFSFNHNYFAENPAVLNDIRSILNGNTTDNPRRRAENSRVPLKHRFLEVPYQGRPGSFYWKLADGPGR